MDTTVEECRKCGLETDCINGICQECAEPDPSDLYRARVDDNLTDND